MDNSQPLPVRLFAGIPVALGGTAPIVDEIFRRARDLSHVGCDIHLLEMNGVATAHRSKEFEQLLKSACLVVADGRWLQFLTRRSSAPITQTRGEDLFRSVLAGDGGASVASYFLGSTPLILGRLAEVIERDFPFTTIVGTESPPFRELTGAEVMALAQRISDSGAQIVWVGISTPRQDFLAARLSELTGSVIIAVGAAFDFLSGNKPSAPLWMQRFGLEWAFRLVSEPSRLWRRYLVGGLTFLLRVFLHRKSDTQNLPQSSSAEKAY